MLSSNSLMRSLRQSGQLPVHDFLAPALFAPSRRCISTTTPKSNASAAAPNPDGPASAAQKPKRKPLTKEQRDFLSSALRVNQAGELAATLIYTAQKPPLVNAHPHLRPLMSHMYEQEAGHLRTFNALLAKHRVRPTALYPVWSVLASGLGWGTAVLGRGGGHGAVETEIGTHYNSQIRSLLEMFEGWEADGYEVGPELRDLVGTLRRIRDEELEHLDHALENDAKQAQPYWLLTSVIKAGCRGAIWASERV
ncbi:ubiquinone biosynthesis protein CAT5 [Apiospora rasikravindrae]|uniref:5-demethoxyubiquinone hydroxylase, mitochondrial n=1 Tax=Apiospora rasikravindrae TaxID=990691 RepID=A0ABR1TDL5_9PEZI